MAENPLTHSTVNAGGGRVDHYADGTQHVTQPDGSTITFHPDGRTVLRQDGATQITEPNGTTTRIPPPPAAGELPYEMREWGPTQGPVHDDNSIHVWHADREEVTNVDGSIDIRYRDGRTVHHPATPMQGPIQPGMPRTHTVTGTDGSVLRIEPDGTRTYTHPQSQNPGIPPIVDTVPTIQRFPGDRPQVPPIVRVDPDGTRHAHDLDGTQHITETDGVETIIPPRPLTAPEVRDVRDQLGTGDRFPVAPAGHRGDPEMFVHRDTGEVVLVKGDGTQVRHPGPPPYVFGPPDGDIQPKTTGQVHFEPDGSLVRPIELVSPNGSHGFGTLTTRLDGSTVFERPDHTIVYTAPDGSQPLLPRGAPPPPVVPAGPPPAPKPRGCSPPIIAAVGTILTLIGAGVVLGRNLDDADEDDLLEAAEDCGEIGLAADPSAPVLIAQSCPQDTTTTTEAPSTETTAPTTAVPVRNPDGTYESTSRVTRDAALGATCTSGQGTVVVTSTADTLTFDFGGAVFTSPRGPGDSFAFTAPATAPDGTPGTQDVEGRFDVTTDPMTISGTGHLEFATEDGPAICDSAFSGPRIG